MSQSTKTLSPTGTGGRRKLLTWRNTGAAALFLYGTTFLWLTQAFAGTAKTGGTAWTITQILVLATILGFSVAAWGVYKATSWWEQLAIGSAIFGFAPLVPYGIAARSFVGTGNAAGGIGIHAVGNAIVLLLLVVPPLKQWVRSPSHSRATWQKAGVVTAGAGEGGRDDDHQ